VSSAYSNTDTARRAAVSKAWAKERALVQEGKGTRNWSKSEQAKILSTGKCEGYHGHHKLSVKNHPSEAGNADNIQFLTQKEHYQAHNRNYKNDPQGRYNTETGKIESYADGKVKSEPIRSLDNKLSDSRKDSAMRKYDAKMTKQKEQAKEYAKTMNRRDVQKTTVVKRTNAEGRGERVSATKTSQALRSGKNPGKSGETSHAAKSSQALGHSRSSSGHMSGSHSVSGAKGAGHGASSGGKGASASSGGHGAGSSGGGHGAGNAGGGHGGASGTGGHGGHGK